MNAWGNSSLHRISTNSELTNTLLALVMNGYANQLCLAAIVAAFYYVTAKKDGLSQPIIVNLSEKCKNEAANLPELTEKEISDFVFNAEHGRPWDRPVRHAWKAIEVGIQLGVQTLIEINERTQLVRLNGFFVIVWNDEIHIWNETYPYQCVDYLIIPHGDETGVWVPEIAMINADFKYSVTAAERELLRFYSDGRVMFAPGGMIDFLCKFDLSLFPFDEQICTIHLEAWRYTTRNLLFTDPSVVSINQTGHEQWEITNMTTRLFEVSYPNGNAFSTLHFNLHLRRKYGYYMLTIILPCLLVAAIEIVTFSMPYHKGIRLEVSFTCLLAFSVFQTMVISDLPKSADNPPLLMILISILTFLIAVGIFFQSITMYMAGRAEDASGFPPSIVFDFCMSAAPVLWVTGFEYADALTKDNRLAEIDENDGKAVKKNQYANSANFTFKALSKSRTRKINRRAWHFVARTTDRICCVTFILLFTFGTIATLAIIPAITSIAD